MAVGLDPETLELVHRGPRDRGLRPREAGGQARQPPQQHRGADPGRRLRGAQASLNGLTLFPRHQFPYASGLREQEDGAWA
jgi:hypothetical protein